MNHALLLFFLLCPLSYGQDVPFELKGVKADQDMGAIGRNFSELANRGVDRTDTSQNGTTPVVPNYAVTDGTNAFTGNNTFTGDVIGATKIYFSSGVANQVMNLTTYQAVTGSTLTVTISSTRNIRVTFTAHMLSGSSYGHTFTGAICESGLSVTDICQVYLNGGLFRNCSGGLYISASAGTHNYYACGRMDQYSCTLAPAASAESYGIPYLFSITY